MQSTSSHNVGTGSEREIPQKDPNGLMRNDIAHLREVFKRKHYSPKDGIAEIMFEEGKQKVLDYIEEKMMSRRGI